MTFIFATHFYNILDDLFSAFSAIIAVSITMSIQSCYREKRKNLQNYLNQEALNAELYKGVVEM